MSTNNLDNEGIGNSVKSTVTISSGNKIPTTGNLFVNLGRQHAAFIVRIEDASEIPANTNMKFNVTNTQDGNSCKLGNINGEGILVTENIDNTIGHHFLVLAGAGVYKVQPELSQNATGDVIIEIQGIDDLKKG